MIDAAVYMTSHRLGVEKTGRRKQSTPHCNRKSHVHCRKSASMPRCASQNRGRLV